MIIPSPSPSFIPQNATDVQMLQLLGQLQNQQMSAGNALLLGILLALPIPESWFPIQSRLDWYYSYSGSNFVTTTIDAHLVASILFISIWPLWLILGLVLLYFFIKILISLIQTLIPIFFSRFIPIPPKTFLELTFPSDTSKSSYATSQLYTLLHTLARQQTFKERWSNHKKAYSLEIVSIKDKGIRYILVAPVKNASVIKRSLLSYLPGIKVREIEDYLVDEKTDNSEIYHMGISELKLTNNFALPLSNQKTLDEHDPIAYLTGNMTKLDKGELVLFQVVTTPVLSSIHKDIIKKTNDLSSRIYKGLPLTPVLNENILQKIGALPGFIVITFFLKIIWGIIKFTLTIVQSIILAVIDPNGKTVPLLMAADAMNNGPASKQELLNPYEQEIQGLIKEKINQNLFETSIRILVVTKKSEEFESRISGLSASFGPMASAYQSITNKGSVLPSSISINQRLDQFKRRIISPNTSFNKNPIFSTSEISDLYHFPYANTTKTEDMVKLHSRELPAPISLKNGRKLDVIFGENNYGGAITEIGLTEEERQTHMYILGRTGSGKTTLMFTMAKNDIENGKGLAFIDPHGDVSEDLISCVPLSRKDDLVYVNPIDLKYPVGINLLELTPGLAEDDAELEKEVVVEGVVSLFRKVFSKEENANAHRIEYILRNTLYTAFTAEGCTIFTINKILTNPNFRKQLISKLKDEDLIDFWKNEFGKAGNYQVVKMTQGVTAKVSRFFRSPTARRILEQERSTIDFNTIINDGKILICNFSQGKLGEDTSRLFGTLIMTKLQQATLKRANIPEDTRKTFYLYVDEFQNFATQSFTKMVTEGRKYRMPLIIAEQTTSQQDDENITNIILANVTSVISFRSGNHIDEELMLNQFSPYLSKGEIMNLPRYRFYIKISAIEPEEPFSGITLHTPIVKDDVKMKQLIEASRKNWASIYSPKVINQEDLQNDVKQNKKSKNPQSISGLPA